jgi:hypothetical protein
MAPKTVLPKAKQLAAGCNGIGSDSAKRAATEEAAATVAAKKLKEGPPATEDSGSAQTGGGATGQAVGSQVSGPSLAIVDSGDRASALARAMCVQAARDDCHPGHRRICKEIIEPLLDWLETQEKEDVQPADLAGVSEFTLAAYRTSMTTSKQYLCNVPLHWLGTAAFARPNLLPARPPESDDRRVPVDFRSGGR